MFVDDGEIPYVTFEPNFYSGWAHTRKNMHPELTSTVTHIIHKCAGRLGKILARSDGVGWRRCSHRR